MRRWLVSIVVAGVLVLAAAPAAGATVFRHPAKPWWPQRPVVCKITGGKAVCYVEVSFA